MQADRMKLSYKPLHRKHYVKNKPPSSPSRSPDSKLLRIYATRTCWEEESSRSEKSNTVFQSPFSHSLRMFLCLKRGRGVAAGLGAGYARAFRVSCRTLHLRLWDRDPGSRWSADGAELISKLRTWAERFASIWATHSLSFLTTHSLHSYRWSLFSILLWIHESTLTSQS